MPAPALCLDCARSEGKLRTAERYALRHARTVLRLSRELAEADEAARRWREYALTLEATIETTGAGSAKE